MENERELTIVVKIKGDVRPTDKDMLAITTKVGETLISSVMEKGLQPDNLVINCP